MIGCGRIRKIFECKDKKPRLHQNGNRKSRKVGEHLGEVLFGKITKEIVLGSESEDWVQ